MAASKLIGIVVTSTRIPRVGPHVGNVVKEILEKKADLTGYTLNIVDLDEYKLPVFNETALPGQITDSSAFAHEASRAWSDAIKKQDAYIFISPEYNYSEPGGVKNAIDYLAHEWKAKPLGIVTYGLFGATHASDALNHILSKVGVKVVSTRPQLAFQGGVGPDAFAAMGGNLAPDTKAKWEAEDVEGIVKTFDEVKAILNSPEGAALGA